MEKSKATTRNAIVIALVKRHGSGHAIHKDRREKRTDRKTWKKETW